MCLQLETRAQRAKRPTMAPPELAPPETPEKDAGFCSGGEDDDSEESNRSNSDDSGLKMGRAPSAKNKRKSAEPLRLLRQPCPPEKRGRPAGDWEAGDRVPPHPAVLPRPPGGFLSVEALLGRLEPAPRAPAPRPPEPALPPPPPPPREQRNYKNMTRERRIEANARERTRVHTISAAFDTLRRSIPAYSHNQKLSKLSVLRIACSYIMALSKVAAGEGEGDEDEAAAGAAGAAGPSLAECIESVSKTIQTEGKLRKRRDD